MADLSPNARTVLDHLHTDPYGSHTTRSVAAATGLAWQQVASVFALLTQLGWAIYRDTGGNSRPLTLTSAGRAEEPVNVPAAATVPPQRAEQNAEVGVPLAVLDREDPKAADLVRARMGWAPRHA